ncbi:MAG: NAD(P)-dependent oxidoreductase [Microthrixaceae bacterium]|nr:NAD(P)-dependent oxidoreductase [Microthrixaceae bacterium]
MATPAPDSTPRSVFITGANGFLGRALVQRFLDDGWRVGGVDVAADPDRRVVAGDITDPSSWEHALEGPDLVIHTAAIVSNNISTELAWRTNVIGTQCVLEATARSGAKRFLQISTMGVTRHAQVSPEVAERNLPGRELDERWPLMPTGNPYTDTKIASEHLVLAAHASGLQESTIVRPADIYGPGCRPWILEPIAAMKANKFLLPAKGKGLFTPIYIDDLVEGVVRAGTSSEAAGHIFNVGGEVPVTTLAYFGYLSRMLGMSKPPRSVPTPVAIAAAETVRLVETARGHHTELGRGVMAMLAKTRGVSNDKAHRMLDWWPQIDLGEGMRRVEQWLRAEGYLDT